MKKVLRRIWLTFLVLICSVGTFAATTVWVNPGSKVVLEAFVDKATYAFLTNNSYSQWLRMLSRYADQEMVKLSDFGLTDTLGVSAELITYINFKVNQIEYSLDQDTYGLMEYFATPREMLDRGMGDCEDYAIMKMHLLLMAGFPPSDMFLLAGLYNDGVNLGGHAVLGIIIDGRVWVLDNMRNSIIPLDQYTAFEPWAGINWFGYKLIGTLRN